jgi:sugar phosphate isomerase/epimerase
MTPPQFQFGISEFTTNPWSFAQDVENYTRLGIEVIEICEVKLDKAKAPEQIAQALDAGLTVSSLQPSVRTLFPSQSQPEPKEIKARMDCFRETIVRLAPQLPGVPFVTNTGNPPQGNIQHVLDVAVREYHALAEFAEEHGVRVALEPLNAAIMNIESAIWTVEQAMELIQEVDHPAFGLCLDFWNIWQNANIEAVIRGIGDKIFIVQASDWRVPQSFQDRVVPGQGSIPIASLLKATYDSGYRGPYVVEIFSGDVPDSLWEGDLDKVLRDSRAGVEAAWAQAFA